MSVTQSSSFKKRQEDYFKVSQPHLKAQLNNYTLKQAKRLASGVNLKSTDKILEIGCGSGRFTLPLLSLGYKITGLDFSKELLDELKKEKAKNLNLIRSDIDLVSEKTNQKFNKIIGFFILHHLPDLEKSLLSLKNAATKNATVGFVEPNPFNPLYYPQPFLSKNMSWNEEKGFRKLTPSYLEKTFASTGYKDLKIYRYGFFPPFILNSKIGLQLDNLLENIPIKTFLPFQLITAKIP